MRRITIYGTVVKINRAKLGIGGVVKGNDGSRYGAGCGRFDQSLEKGDSAVVFMDGQFGHIYKITKQ